MSILADCPACYCKVHVPDHLVGQLVQCPTCGERFTAVDSDDASETEEALSEEEALERESRDRPTVAYGAPPDEPLYSDSDNYPNKDEDDANGRQRPHSTAEKPAKVQTIGMMMLIGGILALLISGGAAVGTVFACCMWPGTYYGIVLGILAIVKGAQLLGENAYSQPPPRGIAIMQIINIINGDVPNCVMGILALVYFNEPEVRSYFRR